MVQSNTIKSANWRFSDSARGLIQQLRVLLVPPVGSSESFSAASIFNAVELADIHSILDQLLQEVNDNADPQVQKVYPKGAEALRGVVTILD